MKKRSIALILTAAMVLGSTAAAGTEGQAEEMIILEEPVLAEGMAASEENVQMDESESAAEKVTEGTEQSEGSTEGSGQLEEMSETEELTETVPETVIQTKTGISETADEGSLEVPLQSEGDILIETEGESGTAMEQTELLTEVPEETLPVAENGIIVEEISVMDTKELLSGALQGGDSMETAILLENYGQYQCVLEKNKDMYFRIQPTVSGRYTFRSLSVENEISARLLDNTGETLVQIGDGDEYYMSYGDGFSIRYSLEAGNIYYLRVQDYEGYQGSFTLAYSNLVVDSNKMTTEMSVSYGSPNTLSAVGSITQGQPVSYTWRDPSGAIIGTAASCTIPKAVKSGTYSCTVSDGIIEDVVEVELFVDSGLQVMRNCDEAIPVYGGRSTTISVTATTRLNTLTYQWEKWEINDWITIPDANKAEYFIPDKSAYGFYHCIVSDGCNEETIRFEVYSTDSTIITNAGILNRYEIAWIPDASRMIKVHAESVEPYGPLTYQWYNDNDEGHELIPGATSDSYVIPAGSLEAGKSYQYSCEVSNDIDTETISFWIDTLTVSDSTRTVSGDSIYLGSFSGLVRLQFTPEISGMYKIYPEPSDQNSLGIIYDANRNTLYSHDGVYVGMDSFSAVVSLKAGQTYYVVTGYSSWLGDVEEYSVHFDLIEEDGNETPDVHEHLYTQIQKVEATCVSDGKEVYQCQICGEMYETAVPRRGHTFTAWTVTQEPTALAEGVQTRTCALCGHTESQAVAKLTPTITLNAKTVPLKIKQSTTKIKVSGLAKGDYIVSWKSNKPKIVKVNSNGKLTAGKKTGTAKVTVTLASGLTDTVTVKVQKNDVATKSIKGIRKKATLKKKQKLTLKPQLNPITSADKVKYTSSNTKVATVSAKGVVKAKSKGKTTITVRAGKKTVKCKVTVK